jgi:type IV fimbrial biogenesis protein FimT
MGCPQQSPGYVHGHGTGFTVLECLIVICILAILLIQGVPALRDYGLRQRMSASMHALHGHLAMARNEAVRLNSDVIACPGSPPTGCLDEGHWDTGWFVFEDLNGDRSFQDSESVMATEPGLANIAIRSGTGRRFVRFRPNGSAPGSNGSISFCDQRGPVAARKLVVSNLGRIRREPMPELALTFCPPGADAAP